MSESTPTTIHRSGVHRAVNPFKDHEPLVFFFVSQVMRRDLRFHSNELDLMGELSVPCNRLSPPFHGGCEVRNSRSAIGLNESKDEPKVQRHPAAK